MTADLAFLICVERGKLEGQAILLCRSIRKFAGRYRDAPIYTFQPRVGTTVAADTLAVLDALGAVHFTDPLNVEFAEYGTINKVFACAYAEQMLNERILVFLDSDTVFVNEPSELDLPNHIDVAIRAADSDFLNSTGAGHAMEEFWQPVFRDCELENVPFVMTEMGRRVRAYFSAGLIAVHREAGVFREWHEDLLRLAKHRLIPERGFGRMDEVALLAPVVRRFSRVRMLDGRYNYLIFKRPSLAPPLCDRQLDQLSHIHYRFSFQQPNFLRRVRPPLDSNCEILQWLEQYLPLQPEIDDPVT